MTDVKIRKDLFALIYSVELMIYPYQVPLLFDYENPFICILK